jgi:hypothetical protein
MDLAEYHGLASKEEEEEEEEEEEYLKRTEKAYWTYLKLNVTSDHEIPTSITLMLKCTITTNLTHDVFHLSSPTKNKDDSDEISKLASCVFDSIIHVNKE